MLIVSSACRRQCSLTPSRISGTEVGRHCVLLRRRGPSPRVHFATQWLPPEPPPGNQWSCSVSLAPEGELSKHIFMSHVDSGCSIPIRPSSDAGSVPGGARLWLRGSRNSLQSQAEKAWSKSNPFVHGWSGKTGCNKN